MGVWGEGFFVILSKENMTTLYSGWLQTDTEIIFAKHFFMLQFDAARIKYASYKAAAFILAIVERYEKAE